MSDSNNIDEHSKKILAIRKILKDRDTEKQNANFAKADSMRDLLKEKYGVIVIDQKNGPSGFKFSDGSSNKLKSGYSSSVPIESQRKRKQDDDDDNDNNNNTDSKQIEKKKKQKVDNPKSSKNNDIKKKDKDSVEQNRNKSALTAILGNTDNSGKVKNVQGVLLEDTVIGNGRKAESGNRIKVNYVGRLKSNNKVFDASKSRPFVFKLGRREVITGWDIGIVGMCAGGQRTLTIPPEKAYGKLGAPPTIPPNSTLIFDVTLMEVS